MVIVYPIFGDVLLLVLSPEVEDFLEPSVPGHVPDVIGPGIEVFPVNLLLVFIKPPGEIVGFNLPLQVIYEISYVIPVIEMITLPSLIGRTYPVISWFVLMCVEPKFKFDPVNLRRVHENPVVEFLCVYLALRL